MSETSGHTAVMASKRAKLKEPAPWQALEFFPTPPWATRALMVYAIGDGIDVAESVWEPCCGLRHMSDVLGEQFAEVRASDVFRYPMETNLAAPIEVEQFDFLDEVAIAAAPAVDWIVTNPPFSKAAKMLDHALLKARLGVAFLLRMQWLEGETRFREVFCDRGPTIVLPFVERVPMCEGGLDPEGSTATMYAWFVWLRNPEARDMPGWYFCAPEELVVRLIPPCRARLSKPTDRLLACRHVPGWIAPSKLKKGAREQAEMFA